MGVFGHEGLMLSRSSGNGDEAGETPDIPDKGVGGADDLVDGAASRFLSGSSCGFSRKAKR